MERRAQHPCRVKGQRLEVSPLGGLGLVRHSKAELLAHLRQLRLGPRYQAHLRFGGLPLPLPSWSIRQSYPLFRLALGQPLGSDNRRVIAAGRLANGREHLRSRGRRVVQLDGRMMQSHWRRGRRLRSGVEQTGILCVLLGGCAKVACRGCRRFAHCDVYRGVPVVHEPRLQHRCGWCRRGRASARRLRLPRSRHCDLEWHEQPHLNLRSAGAEQRLCFEQSRREQSFELAKRPTMCPSRRSQCKRFPEGHGQVLGDLYCSRRGPQLGHPSSQVDRASSASVEALDDLGGLVN